MTTGDRHIHEAALYASEEELLSIVVPFLRAGRDAREPTLAVLGSEVMDGVRGRLGDMTGVALLGASGRRANPANVVRVIGDLVASSVAGGAERVRLIAAIPDAAAGAQWDWWARFENAVNRIFAAAPLWNLCLYDLRSVSSGVLDDVLRTHPRITTADGSATNPLYEEPEVFLGTRSPAEPDPVQLTTAPLTDLTDPSAASARRAARAAGQAAGLDTAAADDLVLAVSETVSNGLMYGVPPVRLRIWLAPDRIVTAVDDAGTGPADPLAGLVPTDGRSSCGVGLWLTHRLCSAVVHSRTTAGFTIRMDVDLPEAG